MAGWKVLILQMVYKLLWKSTSSRAGNIIHWDHQQPWPGDRGVHFRGGVIRVWQISWPLLHNCSLIFRFCDGSLARNSCPETSRATVSSLWASQIALVVARCSFWDRSRQPARHFGGSLSVWCGANFEISRARPSALWACQIPISIVKEILCTDLGTEVFYRELVQRSCHGDVL